MLWLIKNVFWLLWPDNYFLKNKCHKSSEDRIVTIAAPSLPPKVVEVYRSVGKVLKRWKSGRLPKAFKVRSVKVSIKMLLIGLSCYDKINSRFGLQWTECCHVSRWFPQCQTGKKFSTSPPPLNGENNGNFSRLILLVCYQPTELILDFLFH